MSHPYFNYKLTAVSQNRRREMTPEEKKTMVSVSEEVS